MVKWYFGFPPSAPCGCNIVSSSAVTICHQQIVTNMFMFVADFMLPVDLNVRSKLLLSRVAETVMATIHK